MSKPADVVTHLSETLTLSEHTDPKNGSLGFWLYDKTRGMNLAMRMDTERDALVNALSYYQRRLLKVEADLATITAKVDAFVAQVTNDEEQ